MSLKKLILDKKNSVFFFSQVLVGGLNYLFQITAAKSLPAEDFGNWAQWLARFSLASFLAMGLQALASLNDFGGVARRQEFQGLVFVLLLTLAGSLFFHAMFFSLILAWSLALVAGFCIGVCIREQNLWAIAASTLLATCSKFIWIFFDASSESFYRSVLVSAVFLILPYFYFIGRNSKDERGANEKTQLDIRKIMVPLALAFFAAWVPQADLLVAGLLLNAQDLGQFSKINLIAKAFYFSFQILAQILLAYSVQKSAEKLRTSHFLILLAAGGACSIFGFMIAPFFSWSPSWVLFNVLDTTVLCLLYLILQTLAVAHKVSGMLLLGTLSLLATMGAYFLADTMEVYWGFHLGLQILLCIFFLRSKKLRAV